MALYDMGADFLAQANGLFEPQRQNNWALEIALGNADDERVIRLSLESFQLPNESNNEVAVPYQNETKYVAGKASYATSMLVLKDFVDIGTAAAVVNWRRLVYDPVTSRVGLARDYKRRATAILLGPDGTHERKWQYLGMWPQAVEYGSLNMAQGEKVTISVTLRFDKAIPLLFTQKVAFGATVAGVNLNQSF